MRTVTSTAELREALEPTPPRGRDDRPRADDGLPPRRAICRCFAPPATACDVVVMSLFVNPTQFGPGEDLDSYPRDEARDAALAPRRRRRPRLRAAGRGGLSGGLRDHGRGRRRPHRGARRRAGSARPGHFRGVTTVVAKLLNSVGPDVAFFGQKDAQQAIVIRRMVRDLDFPVRDRGAADGARAGRARDELAKRLPRARRARARRGADPRPARSRGGRRARARRATQAALDAARAELERAGIEPEYLEAREAERLAPAESLNGRPVLVAVAARVGRARLIDNVVIGGWHDGITDTTDSQPGAATAGP